MQSIGVTNAEATVLARNPDTKTRPDDVSPVPSDMECMSPECNVKKIVLNGISRIKVAGTSLYNLRAPSFIAKFVILMRGKLCACLVCIVILSNSIGFVIMTWQRPAPAPAIIVRGTEILPSLSESLLRKWSFIASLIAFSGNVNDKVGMIPEYKPLKPLICCIARNLFSKLLLKSGLL